MKKLIAIIASFLIMSILFTGCNGNNKDSESNDNEGKKLSIVTTIFPEYDWVKNILGEQIKSTNLTMLLDNGVDLHSYQPSAEDMLKVSKCDLFIYVGGESDSWVDNVLKASQNKNMQVINLLDVLGSKIKEEEQIEGMEAEEEDEAEEEGPEYDEHVWLSLRNTKKLCSAISESLCKLDSKNSKTYESNLKNYTDKLSILDKEYSKVVNNSKNKTILFGDRFPFRYLVDDYHIKYYAAFVGCSAETEASFKTIKFLANKVDELKLKTVLTIENPKHKIAQTIVKNTKEKNQKILSLNSMQSVTSKDIKNGNTYIGIMKSNLTVLKKALG